MVRLLDLCLGMVLLADEVPLGNAKHNRKLVSGVNSTVSLIMKPDLHHHKSRASKC